MLINIDKFRHNKDLLYIPYYTSLTNFCDLPQEIIDYINYIRDDTTIYCSVKCNQMTRYYGFNLSLNDITDNDAGNCNAHNSIQYHVPPGTSWKSNIGRTDLHFNFVKLNNYLPPILCCIKRSGGWILIIPLERGNISIFSKKHSRPLLFTTELKKYKFMDKYVLNFTYNDVLNFTYTYKFYQEIYIRNKIVNTPWKKQFNNECHQLILVYKRLALAKYVYTQSVDVTTYNKSYNIIKPIKQFISKVYDILNKYVDKDYIKYIIDIINYDDLKLNHKKDIISLNYLKDKININNTVNNQIIKSIELISLIYSEITYRIDILNILKCKIKSKEEFNEYIIISGKYFNKVITKTIVKINTIDIITILQEYIKSILPTKCLIPKNMGSINLFDMDQQQLVFDNVRHTEEQLKLNLSSIYETYEKNMFHKYISTHYRQLKIKNKYNNKLLKQSFEIFKELIINYKGIECKNSYEIDLNYNCRICRKNIHISSNYNGSFPTCRKCRKSNNRK